MQATSGYEAALDPWMVSLFSALGVLFPSAPAIGPARAAGLCRYSVSTSVPPTLAANVATDSGIFEQACKASGAFQQLAAVAAGTAPDWPPAAPRGAPGEPSSGKPASPPPPSLQAPFWAPVTCSRRITAADHWQVVQHIEFDISASSLTYRPGDLLTTLPRVPQATGRKFLQRIGIAPGVG